MRGQAMCQTIHPDVDRGKAQRLAVILPRQERTITDRLRLMLQHGRQRRSEEHTSELQSLMRISYAVFCLKKKIKQTKQIIQKPMKSEHTPRLYITKMTRNTTTTHTIKSIH